MAKKKEVYRTEVELKCVNNHVLIFVQEGDSPEPPFCLSCLLLFINREVKKREQVK